MIDIVVVVVTPLLLHVVLLCVCIAVSNVHMHTTVVDVAAVVSYALAALPVPFAVPLLLR